MVLTMYEPYEVTTKLFAIEGKYESGEPFYRWATSEDGACKIVRDQYNVEMITAVVPQKRGA